MHLSHLHRLRRGLVAAVVGLGLATQTPPRAQAAEEFLHYDAAPPQFIVISFDNGRSVLKWRELTALSRHLTMSGAPVQFTFFFSAVNLLSYKDRKRYRPPRLARGRSNIGFGGTRTDVANRIAAINAVMRDGHEFASHAVGHFQGGKRYRGSSCRGRAPGVLCGANWSRDAWRREHAAFEALTRNAAANNQLDPRHPTATAPRVSITALRDMIGFRAPHLSVNRALFETLRERGFRYDASWPRGAPPDAWPTKDAETGLWLYKLPRIRFVSPGGQPSRRLTLAMDYNFCAQQARRRGHDCARPNRSSDVRDAFGKQMLASYLAYFRANYTGNRAPMHIGHHFSDFQGGTYYRALVGFMKSVCGLSAVRCVTYR
ncbi:MAG: hypothetical protein AAFR23_10470, partial [Pseudomonadota bacterium]